MSRTILVKAPAQICKCLSVLLVLAIEKMMQSIEGLLKCSLLRTFFLGFSVCFRCAPTTAREARFGADVENPFTKARSTALLRQLNDLASKSGRSVEQEAKRMLEESLGTARERAVEAARRIRESHGRTFSDSAELIREDRNR